MNTLEITQEPAAPFHLSQQPNIQLGRRTDLFSSINAEELKVDELVRRNSYYKEHHYLADDLDYFRDEAFERAAHEDAIKRRVGGKDRNSLISATDSFEVLSGLPERGREEMSTLTSLTHTLKCDFDDIPTMKPKSIALRLDECAFAECFVKIIDPQEIDESIADGLAGSSSRLARGTDFHIGEERSNLCKDNGVAPVDQGHLVFTNKRLFFKGAKSSLTVNTRELYAIHLFSDSIQFSMMNCDEKKTIGFENPFMSEYCGVVLSRMLNM